MNKDEKGSEIVGRAKGGLARAEALTSQERSEIAKKAAAARWLKATHKGNFKEEFGIDVDCYVLNDEAKTAVISQRGMGAAIGLSLRGNAFPRFVAGKSMAKYLGAELQQKAAKPFKFQWGFGGAGQPPSEVNGYDVTLLIDVCKAVLSADSAGDLAENQKSIAVQARVILNASAKSGIRGLVYALAGYDALREDVISAFKLYVREEAREYEKEFPEELYLQWHRLYDIPVLARGRSWQFRHLTVRHIYYPLAKSNGKVLELLRAYKTNDGDRRKKLFQFLNDVGARALRMQIGRVLEMTESSANKPEYESKIVQRFGGQTEFDLDV